MPSFSLCGLFRCGLHVLWWLFGMSFVVAVYIQRCPLRTVAVRPGHQVKELLLMAVIHVDAGDENKH